MLMWDSWQSTSWSSKFSGLLPLHTPRPPTPLAFSLLSTLGPEYSLPLWTSCTTRLRILLLFNSGGSSVSVAPLSWASDFHYIRSCLAVRVLMSRSLSL